MPKLYAKRYVKSAINDKTSLYFKKKFLYRYYWCNLIVRIRSISILFYINEIEKATIHEFYFNFAVACFQII